MSMPYRIVGSGKPIILLHAFPLSGEMWNHTAKILAQSCLQVIVPDFRGFGENQEFTEVTNIEELAKDLNNVFDELSIDKAIICGLSMGGYIAFNFFRMYPDNVSALILCDTTHTNDTSEKRQTRFKLIEEIENKGSIALVNQMLPNLISDRTKEHNAELVDYLTTKFTETKPNAAIAALKGMALRKDHTDILSKINVPTLLIFGENDKITDLKIASVLNNNISNSKLCVLKDAGHYSNLENPEDFNECMLEFLSNL